MRLALLTKSHAVYESSFSGIAALALKAGWTVGAFYHGGCPRPGDPRVEHRPGQWWNFDFGALEDFRPDRVLVFNGSFPWCAAATSEISRRWNTRYGELAWLPQSNYLYLDFQGPGARSRLAETHWWPTSPACAREDRAARLMVKLLRGRYRVRNRPLGLPERYLLVPLQLEDDTSVVQDSPVFKTNASMVGFLHRALAGELPLVVKPHPLEAKPTDPTNMPPGAHVVPPGVPFGDLLWGAAAVAGMNSTCLVESLVWEKPVIQLGHGVACGKNVLAWEPSRGSPRLLDIQEALAFRPDPHHTARVLYRLRQRQFHMRRPPARVLELLAREFED